MKINCGFYDVRTDILRMFTETQHNSRKIMNENSLGCCQQNADIKIYLISKKRLLFPLLRTQTCPPPTTFPSSNHFANQLPETRVATV